MVLEGAKLLLTAKETSSFLFLLVSLLSRDRPLSPALAQDGPLRLLAPTGKRRPFISYAVLCSVELAGLDSGPLDGNRLTGFVAQPRAQPSTQPLPTLTVCPPRPGYRCAQPPVSVSRCPLGQVTVWSTVGDSGARGGEHSGLWWTLLLPWMVLSPSLLALDVIHKPQDETGNVLWADLWELSPGGGEGSGLGPRSSLIPRRTRVLGVCPR